MSSVCLKKLHNTRARAHTHTHTHKHTGVVQGSKSVESLSANNFKKSLVMGGKDYMAEFRTKFGDTAAGNLH